MSDLNADVLDDIVPVDDPDLAEERNALLAKMEEDNKPPAMQEQRRNIFEIISEKLVEINSDALQLVDNQEILNGLDSRGVICKEDAKLIDTYFGKFLKEKISIEEFSASPSKVNYQFSIRFIKESLVKTQEEFSTKVEELKTMVDSDDVEVDLEAFLSKINELKEKVNTLNTKYSDFLEAFITNKNMIFMSGQTFVNIANTPLCDLSVLEIDWLTNSGDRIQEIINGLNDFFNSSQYAKLLTMTSIDFIEPTLFNIALGIKNGSVVTNLDIVANLPKESIASVNKLTDSISNLGDTITPVKQLDDFNSTKVELIRKVEDIVEVNKIVSGIDLVVSSMLGLAEWLNERVT
jgi:hypothetical protein